MFLDIMETPLKKLIAVNILQALQKNQPAKGSVCSYAVW